MKTIFSDFDGVLFDSAKEAYLLARCAYLGIETQYPVDVQEYLKYHKVRYLVSKSWQFYYIFELLNSNISDIDLFEQKYYEMIKNPDIKKINDFDEKFVKVRENLIKNDYDFWNSLDEPYDFFFEVKELARNSDYEFIILTNKKKLPVQNRLSQYGINNIKLFANEDLVSYNNKAEFIADYLKNYSIANCYLIEDSVDNINTCKKYPQIKPLLVNWGYVNPKEKGLSEKEILEIIKE